MAFFVYKVCKGIQGVLQGYTGCTRRVTRYVFSSLILFLHANF